MFLVYFRYLPDEVLTAIHPEVFDGLSSVFVHVDGLDYGTRTHTIILVDGLDRVTFVEETMTDDETWSRQRFDTNLE